MLVVIVQAVVEFAGSERAEEVIVILEQNSGCRPSYLTGFLSPVEFHEQDVKTMPPTTHFVMNDIILRETRSPDETSAWEVSGFVRDDVGYLKWLTGFGQTKGGIFRGICTCLNYFLGNFADRAKKLNTVGMFNLLPLEVRQLCNIGSYSGDESQRRTSCKERHFHKAGSY